jgi:hypothetical protein
VRAILGLIPSMALTALLMSATGAHAQAMDALSVLRAFDTAMNAHDVEAALALFADEAVFNAPSGSFRGRGQIRGYLQSLVTRNYRSEELQTQVAGDRVTSRARVFLDEFRTLGIAPLEAMAEVVVEGGQIRTFTAGFTPESLARLQAAQARAAAAPAQVPRALPRTGGWLAAVGAFPLAGAGLLLTGLILRRRPL